MRKSKKTKRRRVSQLKTESKTILLSEEALTALSLIQRATGSSNGSAAVRWALIKMAEQVRRRAADETILAIDANGAKTQLDIPPAPPEE